MSVVARLAGALLLSLVLALPAASADTPVYLDDDGARAALLETIAARLALMPAVAAAKWNDGLPVADPQREAQVLRAMTRAGQAAGLEPQGLQRFFAAQMQSARSLQRGLFAEWKREGCGHCAGAPSLADTRERLDRVGARQLRALYLAAPLLGADELDIALAELLAEPGEREALTDALRAVQRSMPATLARTLASGALRIGTPGDYAPFAAQRQQRLEGVDIALAIGLALHLGVEPVFIPTSWATLGADLLADRFDVAAGGISVTPERAELGLFSIPYYSGGKTILARCADAPRFGSLAALDLSGVRVIVNPGGTNEAFARANLRHAQLIVHHDNPSVFAEIAEQRADAMITDAIEVELQAARDSRLCRAFPGLLTHADKALFMAPDPLFKERVDAWLREQIESGEIERLFRAAVVGAR